MPDRPRTPLTQNLKQLREQRNLTQTELARRAGMATSAVSHFESGRRKPRAKGLVQLADALACSTDDLVFGPLPEQAPAQAPQQLLATLTARMQMPDFDLVLALAQRLGAVPDPVRVHDLDTALLVAKVALTHIDGARDTHLARHLSDEAKAALADIHCLLYGNDAGRAVVREKLDMALSAFMVPGIPPRPVRKA